MAPSPAGRRTPPTGFWLVGMAVVAYAVTLVAGGATFLALILPLFVALVALHHGVRAGLVLVAAFALLAAALARGAAAAPLVHLLLVAVGAAFLVAYGWGWLSLPRSLWLASAAQLLCLGAAAAAVWLLGGPSPGAQVVRAVDPFLEAAAGRLGSSGASGEEVEQLVAAVRGLVGRTYPVLLYVNLALVNLLNLQLLRPLVVAFAGRPAGPPFPRRWRLPERTGWLLVAAVALLRPPWEPLRVVATNGLILLLFLYVVQGFGLLSHLLHRARVPLLLRGVLYALLVVSVQLYPLLALAGVVEGWLDLRRLRPGHPGPRGGGTGPLGD